MSYVTDASLYSSHEEVFNWEIKFCEATSLFESVASVKVDFIRVYSFDFIRVFCQFHLSFTKVYVIQIIIIKYNSI